MSVIYYLFIDKVGYFKLGRFIDLLQQDLLIALLLTILIFEILRWNRIKNR